MPGGQHVHQVVQRVAGVQDVLDDQQVFALDGVGQVLFDLHLAGADGARAVGGHGHKVHRQGQVDGPGQVGHEHIGSPQHRRQYELLPLIIPGDLRAQLLDALLQLIFSQQDLFDVFLQHDAFSHFRV